MHRLVEAFKHGYARRTELGDPDFVKIQDRIKLFIDKDFAGSLRANISDVRNLTLHC
jgi:gamma-glutamyltranspeptidase/glutathione hydrolase/leukotriene-C4 hydrolase